MGSLVNGCVILLCMAMLGLTGSVLDPDNSRTVVMLQFAVGAAVSLFMVAWRYFKLKESKVGPPWHGLLQIRHLHGGVLPSWEVPLVAEACWEWTVCCELKHTFATGSMLTSCSSSSPCPLHSTHNAHSNVLTAPTIA